MKIGYRKMIQERKATGKSIDSLYRANQQLLTSIEQQKRAMNREIEDMRQKVLHMSDLILEQDLDNIRFTERLESNYDKVKKAEQKKNSGAFTYGRMDKPTRRAVYIGGGITIIGVAAAFIFGN